MIVYCDPYPHGQPVSHRCSDELTYKEVIKRFGLENFRGKVTVWPDGRPDQGVVIHDLKRGQ